MSTGALITLFRLALQLYPRQFRQTFGEEMIEVLAEVMSAERHKGSGRYTRRGLRELAALLAGALREHFTPLSTWFEKILVNRPVWAGVIGYAAGFALLGLPEALRRSIPAAQALFAAFPDLLVFFFAGWLGAAVMASSNRRKETDLFRLGAGLSQLITLLAVTTIYNRLFPAAMQNSPTTWLQFGIIMVYPLANGLLIGLLLAVVRERWWEIPFSSLLGMLGFGAGWLVNRLIVALLQSYLVLPGQPLFSVLYAFLLNLVPDIILGAIIGAALGLAYRGLRPAPRLVTA